MSWRAQTTVAVGSGVAYDLSALDAQRPTGVEPGKQFDAAKSAATEILGSGCVCVGKDKIVTLQGTSHEQGDPSDTIIIRIEESP